METTNDYGKWIVSGLGAVSFIYFAKSILERGENSEIVKNKEVVIEENLLRKEDNFNDISKNKMVDVSTELSDSFLEQANTKEMMVSNYKNKPRNISSTSKKTGELDEEFEKISDMSLADTKTGWNRWLFNH